MIIHLKFKSINELLVLKTILCILLTLFVCSFHRQCKQFVDK
jgi:hypothetical protein